jgi:PleD family two-component response regulator
MRILVVDDSEDSRDLIEAALMSGGYKEITTAGSGWEAFKLLNVGRGETKAPPAADIVLLDIMMPDIDGIETCACIRNDPRYLDTPIIMVTSLDDMDALSSAFVAGANDYINKPLNRVELIARVRSALKLKGELERRQARERELLQFVSNWGDRHASVWIDEVTGLFTGEVAEAYLTSVTERHPDETMSILALVTDRLEVVRAAEGEEAAQSILAEVARAVRRAAAAIGVVAASYRNGLVTIIMPELDSAAAHRLGESLRRSVAELAIVSRESISADHITATIAVASGRVRTGIDRVDLLTRAIATVQSATAAGGDRVVAAGAHGPAPARVA